MNAIVLNILLIMLSAFDIADDTPAVAKKTVTLNRLDLSELTGINRVMNDIFSERDSLSSNEAKFYVITLKKHNNGYFAYIIESTLTTLFEPNDYIGYNIVGDNNEIVIFCGDVKIPESSGDNSPLTFEIYHGIPFRYEPKEWRYYIVNDIYARLIEGVGWLWNFPTEYENTSKDIIIPYPKRRKK
ncbi:MAG: hypothetical protein J5995_04465 [Muribaculaceae bacterium]|nr:hypothetical protein [Muribaculaceae bacterium]